MAAAAILKNQEKSPYFGRSLNNFNKIWHGMQYNSLPTARNFKFLPRDAMLA